MHPLPLLCLSGGGGGAVGEPPTKFSKRDSLIEPLQGGGLVGFLEGVAVKASFDLEYLMINKNVFNFNF